jgi:hypothetical protein
LEEVRIQITKSTQPISIFGYHIIRKMKAKKLILFFVAFVVLTSCNDEDSNSETVKVKSTLIAKGDLLGNGGEGIAEQNIVITDQNAWDDLIDQMNSVNNVSDDFSETDIDFSQYQVITVFDEIRSSGGYKLDLKITADTENIVVRVNHSSPEGVVITILTQPFHIVKIPVSELPIIFE